MHSGKSLSERRQIALEELDETIKESFVDAQGEIEKASAMLRKLVADQHNPATTDDDCARAQDLTRRVTVLIEWINHHVLAELIKQLGLVSELRKSQRRLLEPRD